MLPHKRDGLSFPCHFCEETLCSDIKLNKHLHQHHPDVVDRTCTQCHNTFESVMHRIEHINATHAENEREDEIEELNNSDNQDRMESQRYYNEVKEKYPTDGAKKDFHCEICDSTFDFVTALTNHLRDDHEIVKPFKCRLCGTDVANLPNLLSHISVIHLKQYAFQCQMCGKGFNRSNRLKRHKTQCQQPKARPEEVIKPATKQKPNQGVKCSFCDKTCCDKWSLRRHVLVVHDRVWPFTCDKCGKGFTKRMRLADHIKTEHRRKGKKLVAKTVAASPSNGDTLKKPFHCEICDNRFTHMWEFKDHIQNVHRRSKGFSCQHCGQSFERRWDLQEHNQTVCSKSK